MRDREDPRLAIADLPEPTTLVPRPRKRLVDHILRITKITSHRVQLTGQPSYGAAVERVELVSVHTVRTAPCRDLSVSSRSSMHLIDTTTLQQALRLRQ
jgi:hypothetical protein